MTVPKVMSGLEAIAANVISGIFSLSAPVGSCAEYGKCALAEFDF
jgi:hypothetical protein